MSSDLASISSGEYRKQGILDKINALKQRAALAAGEPTDPAFENSFGDRLSDIDGRRRWVLVGLALQKWHQDLQNRVGEVLREKEGEIYKGRSIRGTAMTQHCWMVGYDRTCAHPTVVISCGQSTVLKRTMRAISQHGVLKAAKFALKGVPFCDLKLRMESRGDSLRKWDYDLDEDNHDLDTSVDDHVPLRFGAEEIIVPHSGKATTLGGFLMVDDVCFGLTAAHTFSEDDQNLDQGSIAANDTETQLYDSDWANGDSDDNPDDSVLDFDSSRKTTQEQQLQRKEKNRIATHQTYESSRGETLRIKAKSRLFSANGLDWALCELGDWGKYAINGVYLPPELRGPDASEYLIFTQAKTTPPLGKVLVATRRGAISGLGTGSDCSIKLGSDDRYRHVWSIQLEESLFSGDSGSWVVDATTGDVYGIIMAGSTGSREEFIIPAVEIGQDICRFMRADTVRLPNLQDVMAARTEHVSARRSTKSSRDDALGWETDESADILDENPLDEKEKVSLPINNDVTSVAYMSGILLYLGFYLARASLTPLYLQRSLLAEILKHSSIDAEALAKVIRDAEIRPKWTEVALPEGMLLDRLLHSCGASEITLSLVTPLNYLETYREVS
ncbi:peptide-N4-(N-acetyl-beta- glucosaminyl)asparagine amidase [Mycoblastus sanguinarius]|nr:peptide-N4-(N-acetyl-beta- glucosaminyl)asparagine amidase [Mycoblastus sanguinarius]